jgi:hypothetical protein
MDHTLALKEQTAERYIFGELSDSERDEFEEHLADCSKCNEDVKAAQIFASNSYAFFREEAHAADAVTDRKKVRLPWWRMRWALAFSAGLNVALAGVALYAFLALVPFLKNEIQVLGAPAVTETFSLAGNARSARPVYSVPRNASAAFRLDLPEQFDSYTCGIEKNAGGPQKTYNLRIAAGRETLDLTIPAAGLDPGDYNVSLRGLRSGQSQLLSTFTLRVTALR